VTALAILRPARDKSKHNRKVKSPTQANDGIESTHPPSAFAEQE
jgi:hypothetical protein